MRLYSNDTALPKVTFLSQFNHKQAESGNSYLKIFAVKKVYEKYIKVMEGFMYGNYVSGESI